MPKLGPNGAGGDQTRYLLTRAGQVHAKVHETGRTRPICVCSARENAVSATHGSARARGACAILDRATHLPLGACAREPARAPPSSTASAPALGGGRCAHLRCRAAPCCAAHTTHNAQWWKNCDPECAHSSAAQRQWRSVGGSSALLTTAKPRCSAGIRTRGVGGGAPAPTLTTARRAAANATATGSPAGSS